MDETSSNLVETLSKPRRNLVEAGVVLLMFLLQETLVDGLLRNEKWRRAFVKLRRGHGAFRPGEPRFISCRERKAAAAKK